MDRQRRKRQTEKTIYYCWGSIIPRDVHFFGIIFNMKSLSNMIPFDFDLKIKFDRNFILKTMQKKSEHFSGIKKNRMKNADETKK